MGTGGDSVSAGSVLQAYGNRAGRGQVRGRVFFAEPGQFLFRSSARMKEDGAARPRGGCPERTAAVICV